MYNFTVSYTYHSKSAERVAFKKILTQNCITDTKRGQRSPRRWKKQKSSKPKKALQKAQREWTLARSRHDGRRPRASLSKSNVARERGVSVDHPSSSFVPPFLPPSYTHTRMRPVCWQLSSLARPFPFARIVFCVLYAQSVYYYYYRLHATSFLLENATALIIVLGPAPHHRRYYGVYRILYIGGNN